MGRDAFFALPQQKRDAILQAGYKEFTGKAYADAKTDAIVAACGISKGILFHYFASKKNFYLFLLDSALDQLTQPQAAPTEHSFDGILFGLLQTKMDLCIQHPLEVGFVNTASKEASSLIKPEIAGVIARYTAAAQQSSMATIRAAVGALTLKPDVLPDAFAAALKLYLNAIINSYLVRYQDCPMDFFANAKPIQSEIRTYTRLFLRGNVVEMEEGAE